MSDNDARARELAHEITKQALGMECSCYVDAWPAESCATAEATVSCAISKPIATALDAAGRRERIAGLREAAVIAGTMAERPYDSEPEFSAVLAVEAAISARITTLEADTQTQERGR